MPDIVSDRTSEKMPYLLPEFPDGTSENMSGYVRIMHHDGDHSKRVLVSLADLPQDQTHTHTYEHHDT